MKTVIETTFLHNFIVKHGVICCENPELQANALKFAPMYVYALRFVSNLLSCSIKMKQ